VKYRDQLIERIEFRQRSILLAIDVEAADIFDAYRKIRKTSASVTKLKVFRRNPVSPTAREGFGKGHQKPDFS
jgi:hypothetical protein